jgi:hypothetical protein
MLGGMFGRGISYSPDLEGRSSAENLTVRAESQGLTFDAMTSSMTGRSMRGMSPQGAAEHLWSIFILPLQAERN